MTPQWLVAAAAVLVVFGAIESFRVDGLEQRGDLSAAYRSFLLSRGFAAVGVALGALGLIWELTR